MRVSNKEQLQRALKNKSFQQWYDAYRDFENRVNPAFAKVNKEFKKILSIHLQVASLNSKINVQFISYLLRPMIGSGVVWTDDVPYKIYNPDKTPEWLKLLVCMERELSVQSDCPEQIKKKLSILVYDALQEKKQRDLKWKEMQNHPINKIINSFAKGINKNKTKKGGRPRIIQFAFLANTLRSHFERYNIPNYQPYITKYLEHRFPEYVRKRFQARSTSNNNRGITESEIANDVTKSSKKFFQSKGYYSQLMDIYRRSI